MCDRRRGLLLGHFPGKSMKNLSLCRVQTAVLQRFYGRNLEQAQKSGLSRQIVLTLKLCWLVRLYVKCVKNWPDGTPKPDNQLHYHVGTAQRGERLIAGSFPGNVRRRANRHA